MKSFLMGLSTAAPSPLQFQISASALVIVVCSQPLRYDLLKNAATDSNTLVHNSIELFCQSDVTEGSYNGVPALPYFPDRFDVGRRGRENRRGRSLNQYGNLCDQMHYHQSQTST